MRKTRSEFEVECAVNVFNSISRVLYHVIEDNDYTASRWDKSDNTEVREYIKDRLGINPKAIFRPIIMDFNMYIIFSNERSFAEFEPGIFKEDRGTLFINFPADIVDKESDIYNYIYLVFEDLYSIMFDDESEIAVDIATYHTRLLIENVDDENTIDHVERVLKEVDVWNHSQKFPCIVAANYKIAMQELFRYYKTYSC